MPLISLPSLLLFLIVLLVRLTIGRDKTGRFYLIILGFAGIIFILWGSPRDVFVISGMVIFVYLISSALFRSPERGRRAKILLAVGIMLCLGTLVFYKYTLAVLSFIGARQEWVDTIRSILEWLTPTPASISLTMKPTPPVAPLGLSFVVLTLTGYLVDCYTRRLKEPPSIGSFFLFITFFPKLSAGPIQRSGDFLRQLPNKRPIRWQVMFEGSFLVVQGLFLKIVCADNAAVVVNSTWTMIAKPGAATLEAIVAAVFFACQIFCDFWGYTCIVRGVAMLLGFHLPENFRYPYIAGSFTAFWRNWHISLTDWIRLYLFYPLERLSRRRLWRILTPIMVMSLVGLWHGASLTFIIWGLIFGLGMAVERLVEFKRLEKQNPLRYVWLVLTQAAVLTGWVFFRSDTVGQALSLLGNIFHFRGISGGFLPSTIFLAYAFPALSRWKALTGGNVADLWLPVLADLLPLLTVLVVHLYGLTKQKNPDRRLHPVTKTILAALMLVGCFLLKPVHAYSFIYFQF